MLCEGSGSLMTCIRWQRRSSSTRLQQCIKISTDLDALLLAAQVDFFLASLVLGLWVTNSMDVPSE